MPHQKKQISQKQQKKMISVKNNRFICERVLYYKCQMFHIGGNAI